MKLGTLDGRAYRTEAREVLIKGDRGGAAGVNLGGLELLMAQDDLDVLYVHASALKALGLPAAREVLAPGEQREPHPFFDVPESSSRRLTSSATIGEREVLIGAYQDGAGDPFADCADGAELLAAVLAFRDAFPDGWAFRNSAALTGWQLMHRPWRFGKRKARIGELRETNIEPVELEGVQLGAQVEVPFGSWAFARERESPNVPGYVFEHPRPVLPYVKAWDVNGQRLAACARLSLGIGGLEQRGGFEADGIDPPLSRVFDKRLPGYHLVSTVGQSFPGLIPPIFEPGWHTTPRVQMAVHLGIPLTVERSIVWTEHVAYLDPFYAAMRDARNNLLALRATYQGASGPNVGRMDGASAAALRALKQSYLQPLGRLRSGKARESGDTFYRPSWYDAIIGQELAREYLRLHELADRQVPVLAVYFDTIICESETPDASDAPGPIGLSSQLGKYKPVGVLPTKGAHHLLYGGDAPNVGLLVQGLKVGAQADRPVLDALDGERASTYTRPVHGGYPNGS